VAARRSIYLAPFGELSEPGVVAELAARAEEPGWDGFFLWDHVAFHRPVRAIADPWVTLAAMAVATQRLVLGPLVTPVARRRPHKLARETVTLDRLSGPGQKFGPV
jgi:alkanesulfonate monooxygenase SsuD/methylene tetrahydromethanopterin reductase-like flavin-dependent oxidoreductase (luciferase family)